MLSLALRWVGATLDPTYALPRSARTATEHPCAPSTSWPCSARARRIARGSRPSIRAIKLTDAGGWFDGEYRETWPAFATVRYLGPDANGNGTREERDRLLAEAEVILGGFPFSLDMRSRAPQAEMVPSAPAGASNLVKGDLWGSDVVATTSRGVGNTRADRGIRGGQHAAFRQGPARAAVDRTPASSASRAIGRSLVARQDRVHRRRRRHRPRGRPAVRGGRHARRRHAPERQPGATAAGFASSAGPGELDRFLAEQRFRHVCCHWTPETTNLFNAQRFAAMKAGAVLVNIARGEIVDEHALTDALARRSPARCRARRLRRRIRAPAPPELWSDRRVLITPHISSVGTRISARRHRHLLRQPARVPRRPPAAERHRLGAGVLAYRLWTCSTESPPLDGEGLGWGEDTT